MCLGSVLKVCVVGCVCKRNLVKDFCPRLPLYFCFVFGVGKAFQKKKGEISVKECLRSGPDATSSLCRPPIVLSQHKFVEPKNAQLLVTLFSCLEFNHSFRSI